MVVRERVTVAVVLVLMIIGGWYVTMVLSRGLGTNTLGEMALAAVGIMVLTSIFAGVAALSGGRKGQQIDERDHRVTFRSQMIRGFFYLALSFGLLGKAIADGNYTMANTIFLVIIGIEIISGMIMLMLYRLNG